VAPNDRRVILRAALAAVLISAVGLSACGRKGPLEPPPSAAATDQDPDANPNDAGKPDRGFPLDFLL
jgi:predicted small lipoprotein YifL